MATITETATFAPELQLWQLRMRPDNTPVDRGRPIGRITWFASHNTAAKITTNVVELAVSLTVPTRQFAYRLINPSWAILETDADAVADVNDWHDVSTLTVPTTDQTIIHTLGKPAGAVASTITNLFVSLEYLAGPVRGDGGTGPYHTRTHLEDPFLPASPMIWRVINTTANACGVMTFTSHMWAYVYTIEQYRQGSIWTSPPVGSA